jgi:hypothetical protein
MGTVMLKSDSVGDIELIIALAKKLGIEICSINESNTASLSSRLESPTVKHNFLNSKGLWKNRNVHARTLRDDAWKIQS